MNEITHSVIGDDKFEGKHHYSTFVADADFYKKLADKFDYTERYIKKYINVFEQIGVLEYLGEVKIKSSGKRPSLYADGYYTEYGPHKRKVHFIKNDKDKFYRDGLRKLSELLRE